jgi:hypothetical protein
MLGRDLHVLRITLAVALLACLGQVVGSPLPDTLIDTLRAVRTVSVEKYIRGNDSTFHLISHLVYGHWYSTFPPPTVSSTIHAALMFNLSPIPDTALVTAAQLGFFQHSDDSAGTPECRPRVHDYPGARPESLFNAIESAAAVATEFEAHYGWNRVLLTPAGVEAIGARLTADSLRLAVASGAWGELGYAFGSSDPETLRPYLLVSYLPSAVKERVTPDALRPALTIAPNPCRSATTVRVSPVALRPSPCALAVYDAAGRLASSVSFRSSSFVISTSSFPPGVYVARCTSGTHVLQARFVVASR